MRSRTIAPIAAAGLAALIVAGCSTSPDTEASPDASVTATASAEASTGNTIPEVAAQAGDFETLVDAVTAAGLADTLSSGEYTVFAPTDAAFRPLVQDGTVKELLKNPEDQLQQILLYHVVEGKVTAADVAGMDGEKITTVQGGTLTVNVSNAGKVTLTDETGNTVEVVTTDVDASNGVIHVIDGVLLPS